MTMRWTGLKRRAALKGIVLIAASIALPVIAWAQWTTSSNDIYNSNSGNVGIGTTSPASLGAGGSPRILEISNAGGTAYGLLELSAASSTANGDPTGALEFGTRGTAGGEKRTAAIHSFMTASSASTVTGDLRLYTTNAGTNSEKMRIQANGNVGIGTTSPSAKLQVSGGPMFVTDRGDGCCADIRMFGGDNTQETHLYSYGATLGGRFGIHKYGSGSAGGEVFSILANGKVGIGTTAPSTVLEVVGDITVSGNIAAKYQDLAEWVSTNQVLPAGTVVVLDTEIDNGVVRSSIPYDTHIAGVVSDSPGIILGVAGPGKLKIATTGRVKVRVDTSNGPIRRGDLLVTGTKEGTAMRSESVSVGGIEIHRPGTLIGKALETLDHGEGEILVLLSLQ